MDHLYTAHPFNRHVTTLTYETRLVPEADEEYVTPTMLQTARDVIATKTEIKDGFKNSFIVTLHVPSPREGAKPRKVSIKVFKNLRLHITGTHSLEMVYHVVDVVKGWLNEFTGVAIKEDVSSRQIDVVLYKYQLPGEINLARVREVLTEKNILSIYDPNNYAGVRAKFPVDNNKDASVMIFRKGKIIIIIPRQDDFDKTLQGVIQRIENEITSQWEIISVKHSKGLKRKHTHAVLKTSPHASLGPDQQCRSSRPEHSHAPSTSLMNQR
jgi:TATA-box binding protein (TBP) (component of TFIID and TFIIIB)